MDKKTILIIGGGPAGLTAALEAAKAGGLHPIVIEMSDHWGGISRTVEYKGNRIDIGGHRFFSKSDRVMQWWNDILPIQNREQNLQLTYRGRKKDLVPQNNPIADGDKVMLVRKRRSSIYYNRHFFDYPLQLRLGTLQKIGLLPSVKIMLGYFKSRFLPMRNVQTLEDFFINRFGDYLYRTFFKAYTEKVWGVPCSEISAEWGNQRVKGLSIGKSALHFFKKSFSAKAGLKQKTTETSLIEYFLYPKFGPGQMWEEVAEKVMENGGELHKNTVVRQISIENGKVVSVGVKNTKTHQSTNFKVDYCISSMPVPHLLKALSVAVPENVKEVADGLRFRDFITVGLLLKKLKFPIKDNWIYIQEPDVKVGRIQFFNNWSPFLVDDRDTVWIGLEYFCTEHDHLWNMSEPELIAFAKSEMTVLGFMEQSDFLDGVAIKMPKTYPAYFGTHSRFGEIRAFTDAIENLFLVGRNGMHKYNNQDHSMLTAMEAIKKIKAGDPDKDSIWQINTEQDYHEATD